MSETAERVRWTIQDLEVLPRSEGTHYELMDRFTRQLEVYRREDAQLVLKATLLDTDEITSSLLPGFCCIVGRFFV